MKHRALRAALAGLLAIGALGFGACSDDDNDEPEQRQDGRLEADASGTVPSTTATVAETPSIEPNPNDDNLTPTGNTIELINADIRQEFEGEQWFAEMQQLDMSGDTLVVVMAEGASEDAVLQACTAVAGRAYSNQFPVQVQQIRVDNASGDTLATATGPQCQSA